MAEHSYQEESPFLLETGDQSFGDDTGLGRHSTDDRVNNNSPPPNVVKPVGFSSDDSDDDFQFAESDFVNRVLLIQSIIFEIMPNGGTGDCMFKAISQALNNNDESKCNEVRKKVVDFITADNWEKYQESMEIQYSQESEQMAQLWKEDPISTYKNYMSVPGTLGSLAELTASGELFQFNFATIQEYSRANGRLYRIENCCPFDSSDCSFFYFFFTGDYDNGHWELLLPQIPINLKELKDGMYKGKLKTVIEGTPQSFDEWLKENMRGAEEYNRSVFHIPARCFDTNRVNSSFAFGNDHFTFSPDGSVSLNGKSFMITKIPRNDLFSVLSCIFDAKGVSDPHELELALTQRKEKSLHEINQKLITQPKSNGLTIDILRYGTSVEKGNIQDLVSAADNFNFSFVLFVMPMDELLEARFVHVDRWGGDESSRLEHFYMQIDRDNDYGVYLAHWYHLTPIPSGSQSSEDKSVSSDRDSDSSPTETSQTSKETEQSSKAPLNDYLMTIGMKKGKNIEPRTSSGSSWEEVPSKLMEEEKMSRKNYVIIANGRKLNALTRIVSSEEQDPQSKDDHLIKTMVHLYDPESKQSTTTLVDAKITNASEMELLIKNGEIKLPSRKSRKLRKRQQSNISSTLLKSSSTEEEIGPEPPSNRLQDPELGLQYSYHSKPLNKTMEGLSSESNFNKAFYKQSRCNLL